MAQSEKFLSTNTSLYLEYSASISAPQFKGVTCHPRGNPHYSPLEDLTIGLTMNLKRDPPTLFKIDTTNSLALAIAMTLTDSTQREGGLVLIHLW